MIYDVAIIGTGPAGFSAAMNVKIHNKTILWIGAPGLSEKITKAEKIMNYPGLPAVSGQEMRAIFSQQAADMGLTIHDAMVNSILPFGSHYALMAGNDFFEAKSIILATGITNTSILPGEEDLVGTGVSYCATCDGGLYRGKKIAVICNARRFAHEVSFLASLAETVYFFPGYADAGCMEDNVIQMATSPNAILGEKKVTGISCADGSILDVDGVFCLRDTISLHTLLPGLQTENNHIAVDRQMRTNLPGIFAAGDCTGRPYQYVKAAGEGNIAAHSVIAYLANQESLQPTQNR